MAGQRYILEEGVTQVSYTQLLEAGFMTPVQPAADETYDHIIIHEEGGTIETASSTHGTVTFTY